MISTGSMELVVLILQVKRSDLGLDEEEEVGVVEASFGSPGTWRLEPSSLPFLSNSEDTLLVSLEVSLEKRLLVPLLRVWERGEASWERVGEAGGPL